MIASDLFKLPESFPFADCFPLDAPPWEWLPRIKRALDGFDWSQSGLDDIPVGVSISGSVWLHPSVKLPPYCVIEGPAYIGAGSQIRPGAYLRGNVIVGENCVIGHNGEYKNCMLIGECDTPHRPYVGDSILGVGAHLGAGVVLANLRLDQKEVLVTLPDGSKAPTGLRKFGALMGDGAEVGCNAVLQPGAIMGQRAVATPCGAYGGWLKGGCIHHARQTQSEIPRRD